MGQYHDVNKVDERLQKEFGVLVQNYKAICQSSFLVHLMVVLEAENLHLFSSCTLSECYTFFHFLEDKKCDFESNEVEIMLW